MDGELGQVVDQLEVERVLVFPLEQLHVLTDVGLKTFNEVGVFINDLTHHTLFNRRSEHELYLVSKVGDVDVVVILGEDVSLDGSPAVHVGEPLHLRELVDLSHLGLAAIVAFK